MARYSNRKRIICSQVGCDYHGYGECVPVWVCVCYDCERWDWRYSFQEAVQVLVKHERHRHE